MSGEFAVLIADDQPHLLLTLQYLLSTIDGVKVYSATNGQEAMDLALKHRPDLILLDVSMPIMTGIEACQAIRAGWEGHAGQIWFVTARGAGMDEQQARQFGAERLVTKPFDPDGLLNAVRQQMSAGADVT